MKDRKCVLLGVALLLGSACIGGTCHADPPKVDKLRVQTVGDTTFFQLLLEPPEDMRLPQESQLRDLARMPRLVPQDDATRAVYFRIPDEGPRAKAIGPPPVTAGRTPLRGFVTAIEMDLVGATSQLGMLAVPGDENLQFLGKVKGKAGKAKLLLQYPIAPAGPVGDRKTPALLLNRLASWAEVELILDFATAKEVDLPGIQRRRDASPHSDDLEALWAAAQGKHFALLQAQSPQFGFYAFARETTSVKYSVPAPEFAFANQPGRKAPDEFFFNRQLYEITTGAAAITESLALQRMRNAKPRRDEQRSVAIGKLPVVTIAEHPWKKMMWGKEPAIEPLAALVPADNYYVHFNSFAKFLEAGDLVDQWGTSLMRAVEVSGRDYRLKERLEQQLCLQSTKLSRILGPALIKSLALTGSDPYVREGSDVTVLFHVRDRSVFLKAVEPHLKEARKHFKLKEDRQTYHDVAIESFVSPLREVSLHRAGFDDYIVCGNSSAGIRRVIDAYKNKIKALAQSLDFQYMRTVFRADDPLEDGFVFLSDAFIRNLAGPALRIKERRRLEALTSLSIANNAALFTAWETGRLPTDHKDLLAYIGLKPDLLFSPDGNAIVWNGEHGTAHSSFYNTLAFATPLIEIPIDRVTPQEQTDYEQFRREYMGLWRQYFDPIGMRIKLGAADAKKGSEVRWETCILPLVENSQYNELRRLTGDGTVKLDPASIHARTIAQFVAHLSPNARQRNDLGDIMKSLTPDIPGLGWLGSRFSVRVDDSPVYGKIAQRIMMREIDRNSVKDFDEDVRLFFQMPVTVGVEIRNPLVFGGVLATIRKTIDDALPGTLDWAPLKDKYKEITVVRIKVRPEGVLGAFGGRKDTPFTPALYYALVDGTWFLSTRQECIHDEIDAALVRRQPEATAKMLDVNSSVYFSPEAAVTARDLVSSCLEWQTHGQAVASTNLLYPLYRGKLVAAADNQAAVERAALKYLGFVPVSPDYAPFVYDVRTDEVINKRHGNLRHPRLHDTMADNAPLAHLLEQFRSLRADLRFQDDGLRSVVTFTRK